MTFRRFALLLLTLAFIAGCASTSSAVATPAPVSTFGFSDGTLIDTGSYSQLDNMAGVLGSDTGSFFRGAVHWAPENVSGPSTSTYDTAVLNAWNDGLTFLPEVHTSKAGGGGYIDPLTCSGPGCGTSNFESAVTGFAERYGPGGAFAQAHPGFPGITRFETWNEPNTNTGSLNATNTDDTDPAEFNSILHAESVALVNAATAGGWLNQLQIACCAFGNPGTGNHSYSLAYFKKLIAVPGNTVWSDINPSGALPGVITVHMYYGTLDPTNCSDTGGDASSAEKCPKFLEDYWAPYIQAAEPNDGMGITEGGYSGPVNCSYTNTVSEQAQADDDKATIDYYRAHPDINMQFLAYYKAEDDDTSGTTGSTCWQDGLAAVATSAGTWKPWATTYNALVAADSSQGNPAPTVTTLSPDNGQVGDSIDVQGTGFSDATEVDFNGTSTAFTVNSDTDLTATVPAGAATGPVEVTSPEGTGTSSTSFTVNPTSPTPAASDLFGRTVSNAWGNADIGGPWTQGTGVASDFSVNGFKGFVAASTTATDTMRLDSMTPIASQDGSVKVSIPTLPTGGSLYIILGARKQSTGNYYQARFQVFSGGGVTIQLKTIESGTATVLATESSACTMTATTLHTLTFNLEGASPTALSASCAGGTPLAYSDSTSDLQNAGTNLVAVNPSGGTSLPITVKFDNLTVAAP